jgi:hypothetical protein
MKSETDSYEPSSILIAWGSASFGSCLIIFCYLFPLATNDFDSGHPWARVIGTNTFLFHTVWCIASYFVATALTWLLGDVFRRFIPSWAVISLLGSLLFTFTFWSYGYWNAVQSYRPDSLFHFQPPPPSFETVMWSALIWSFIYSLFAGVSSLCASLIPRNGENALHLND